MTAAQKYPGLSSIAYQDLPKHAMACLWMTYEKCASPKLSVLSFLACVYRAGNSPRHQP